MKKEILNSIEGLIKNSKIPEAEKSEFFSVCSKIPDADLESFHELVSSDPSFINIFFENYKLKKNTSLTDTVAWKEIISNEKELVSQS